MSRTPSSFRAPSRGLWRLSDWLDRPGRFRSVGDGQIDFGGIFDRLTRYGYDGWAVLEWECCLKNSMDGRGEGARFIAEHVIRRQSGRLMPRMTLDVSGKAGPRAWPCEALMSESGAVRTRAAVPPRDRRRCVAVDDRPRSSGCCDDGPALHAPGAGMLSSRPERSRAEGPRYRPRRGALLRQRRGADRKDERRAMMASRRWRSLTPNDSHAPLPETRDVGGLDVMIEKPLCNEFAEARRCARPPRRSVARSR